VRAARTFVGRINCEDAHVRQTVTINDPDHGDDTLSQLTDDDMPRHCCRRCADLDAGEYAQDTWETEYCSLSRGS
jgi:hypothetical protein